MYVLDSFMREELLLLFLLRREQIPLRRFPRRWYLYFVSFAEEGGLSGGGALQRR